MIGQDPKMSVQLRRIWTKSATSARKIYELRSGQRQALDWVPFAPREGTYSQCLENLLLEKSCERDRAKRRGGRCGRGLMAADKQATSMMQMMQDISQAGLWSGDLLRTGPMTASTSALVRFSLPLRSAWHWRHLVPKPGQAGFSNL